MTAMIEKKAGLDGVVAADSAISHVDGDASKLIYRGYMIEDLAENCKFSEVAHLLWHGKLPTAHQQAELERNLAAHRPLSERMVRILSAMPASAPPMSLLRTCVSAIGLEDPRAESNEFETNLEIAIELTAQVASVIAAIRRLRRGLQPVEPEPGMSHAASFLHMLSGEVPDDFAAEIFDDCLILHAEHGFNASTFTARVIAATLSDTYSAITGAIGALRGPLHGGANMKVMLMLEEIGEPSKAADYVKDLLARKQKVMGFGHRVYKTEDPRARILRRWSQELGERLGNTKWFEMSSIIEKVMFEEKGIMCNVDFYSASVYTLLGIPADLFTPIFALSRTTGWTAHILEQYSNNRLIRPLCNYVGPIGLKVIPINERG
jgi:citrate synthase